MTTIDQAQENLTEAALDDEDDD
ncbi:hypothetical protein CITRIK5_30012 [Citricoccus sp. K5]|nr:hypothetical protein CITRIK5_30012 [Citricoccus sp. K5]